MLLVVTIPYILSAGETKFSLELWNRMSMIDDGSDADPATSFSVERGYFTLKPKLSDNVSGRFTLDFFSSDDDTNGAGLKMKYAYLDFKNILPLPEATLSVGLTKNYFGTIYSWKYETIEKDPSDLWKMASSTDYGLVFSGKVPAAKMSYNLGIYNGEGYKKSGDNVNTEYAYLANVRIKPMDMLELGGSFSLNSKNNPNDEMGEENPDHQAITAFAGMGKFDMKGITLLGQFLGKSVENDNLDDSDAISSQAISLLGIYNLEEATGINMELVGRYDMYDPNTDADDDGKNLMLFGANYYLQKNVQLQANYEITSHENDDQEDISQIMLQLRWSFSNILN
jgi:hypothetical protein